LNIGLWWKYHNVGIYRTALMLQPQSSLYWGVEDYLLPITKKDKRVKPATSHDNIKLSLEYGLVKHAIEIKMGKTGKERTVI
jgi:hypothetical protein